MFLKGVSIYVCLLLFFKVYLKCLIWKNWNLPCSFHKYASSFFFFTQCNLLNEKLELLLETLKVEAQATPLPPGSIFPIITAAVTAPTTTGPASPLSRLSSSSFTGSEKHLDESQEKDMWESRDSGGDGGDTLEQMIGPSTSSRVFKPRDALMSRANSLKKAVRQIIEQTEKGELGSGQDLYLVMVVVQNFESWQKEKQEVT